MHRTLHWLPVVLQLGPRTVHQVEPQTAQGPQTDHPVGEPRSSEEWLQGTGRQGELHTGSQQGLLGNLLVQELSHNQLEADHSRLELLVAGGSRPTEAVKGILVDLQTQAGGKGKGCKMTYTLDFV